MAEVDELGALLQDAELAHQGRVVADTPVLLGLAVSNDLLERIDMRQDSATR